MGTVLISIDISTVIEIYNLFTRKVLHIQSLQVGY